MVAARLAAEAAGAGGGAFVIGAPALKELVAAAGRRWSRRERRRAPPRSSSPATALRLRASCGRRSGRSTPARRCSRPAATRRCRCPAASGPGPARCWPRSRPRAGAGRRSPASRSATCSSWRWRRSPGAERVAMVGDRLSSDIAGGHAAGLATVLVLSGTSGRRAARGPTAADPRPTTSSPTSPPCSRERRSRRRGRSAAAQPRLRRRLRPHLLRPGRGRRGAAGAARLRQGPLGYGDVAVGVVVGCYAISGLLLRPLAGRLADRRGRKPTALVGALLLSAGGFLYLPRLGLAGPDRRPAGARGRRGHHLHRRLGLDRRPLAARAARPHPRPLRARGLGRARVGPLLGT